ncbi:four-carbon acid sugar kinase family protein [Scandinavium sp. H11S7]|uniref:3-oxo-tetronate kinase n=1 Tax=Scandinavium TaxID=2726810 RepID=UPI0021660E1C|nr:MULTISPECIES: 3-oxo-tetronate kinase [Scandinavium]MCS2155421.1 four-carbon acid sugar kinase family protein [Scandinavium hiltneri]MCS2168788.1 four-carbon acid sugar kinase family protein [Scandinavium tedordense]
MTLKLGIIADDFTGATDIASFMATAGWKVIQMNGTPSETLDTAGLDAIVISLKSRSCPSSEATTLCRLAAQWLIKHGCQRLYFKYCSTFDSTPEGNIGPVTDMLLHLTQLNLAVLCPALPVNGRTVEAGHLFVHGQLLNESGMQNHPLTPMTDANLMRVMEKQASGTCGLVPLSSVHAGKDAIRARLQSLEEAGKHYAVLDAVTEDDLLTLAAALPDRVLLTGGSGLAGALAMLHPGNGLSKDVVVSGMEGKAIVLAGSCSVMTNQQVQYYRQLAPARAVEVERAINDSSAYIQELVDWYLEYAGPLAPMIYATCSAEEVKAIQACYGVKAAGSAIENLFALLAIRLNQFGVNKFIVAGGETSSLLVQRLNVASFTIGESIAPGVPWVKDIKRPLWLALKSGNFGDESFFSKAQESFS